MDTAEERLKKRYATAQQKTRERIEKTVSSLGRHKNESSIKADWHNIVEYVDGVAALKQEFGFRGKVAEIQSDPWPKEGDERMSQFGRKVVVSLARLNMGKELEASVREFLDELNVLPRKEGALPEAGHTGSAVSSGRHTGEPVIEVPSRHAIGAEEETDPEDGQTSGDEVEPR